MHMENVTYLSLGSNMGDRLWLLQKALLELNEKAGEVVAVSAVYESPAMGFDGDDFLNICCRLATNLSPTDLMALFLKVESQFGRARNADGTYGPRPIDIDMLYYDSEIIDTESLTVPHPSLHLRNFVLRPLADVAPQHYHPLLQKDTRNLLQECKDRNLLQKCKAKVFKNLTALFAQCPFMAIEGNIGAGKSTLAHKIAADFNAKLVLERFADNPFLPKFYEDRSRYAFPLEMSFLADRYQQFTDDTSQFDLFKNFMVSDYDIFKSLIFAKVTLQKEEYALYHRMFRFMYKEVRKPDVYIYLYQNTPRLLENIKKRGRPYEQAMSPDYLEAINQGYMGFIKTLPKQSCLVIDMENVDFVAHTDDYKKILLQIASKVIQRKY